MAWRRRASLLLLLVTLPLCSAFGAPRQGVAVFGGLASHNSHGEITEGKLDGATYDVAGSGLSIGVDYQLPVADALSLNFFLMSSSETASSSKLNVDAAGHGILGVEARYWIDDWFAGAHVGNYSEALLAKKSNGDTGVTGGSGLGFGVSVGWAAPEGGMFLMAQYDRATITFSDATSALTGLRLQLGYRWGK